MVSADKFDSTTRCDWSVCSLMQIVKYLRYCICITATKVVIGRMFIFTVFAETSRTAGVMHLTGKKLLKLKPCRSIHLARLGTPSKVGNKDADINLRVCCVVTEESFTCVVLRGSIHFYLKLVSSVRFLLMALC
jgi:hypothetical protein